MQEKRKLYQMNLTETQAKQMESLLKLTTFGADQDVDFKEVYTGEELYFQDLCRLIDHEKNNLLPIDENVVLSKKYESIVRCIETCRLIADGTINNFEDAEYTVYSLGLKY